VVHEQAAGPFGPMGVGGGTVAAGTADAGRAVRNPVPRVPVRRCGRPPRSSTTRRRCPGAGSPGSPPAGREDLGRCAVGHAL